MQREFGLPLVLLVIDTLIASAGFTAAGEENDAATGQIVMNVLERVARNTGALALGTDHFGKKAETGTRGTSAKEGAADVVLALLGDKSITGEVSNTNSSPANAARDLPARNIRSPSNPSTWASIGTAAGLLL